MNRDNVMAKKRFLLIGLLIVLIAGVTFGYAALQTTLTITGDTKISKVGWLVHFKNLQITPGSASGSTVTLGENDTKVEYHITLSQPGDYYEFTVDIANDGTIDAKLSSLNIETDDTVGTRPYITYTRTGLPAQNSVLSPGSANYIPVKIRFDYPADITPEQLPTSDYTFNETITLNYVQNR